LQALEQNRDHGEGCSDDEWSRPSDAEHQREEEMAYEMLDPPTESCAALPIGGSKSDDCKRHQTTLHTQAIGLIVICLVVRPAPRCVVCGRKRSRPLVRVS